MEVDQQFVETVVKAIVNHPDDVRTERTIDQDGVLITLHVNQEDFGYVIGKEGETARAIRRLLRAVGSKSNQRVSMKLYEPEGSRPPRASGDERKPRQREAPSDRDPLDPSALDI